MLGQSESVGEEGPDPAPASAPRVGSAVGVLGAFSLLRAMVVCPRPLGASTPVLLGVGCTATKRYAVMSSWAKQKQNIKQPLYPLTQQLLFQFLGIHIVRLCDSNSKKLLTSQVKQNLFSF